MSRASVRWEEGKLLLMLIRERFVSKQMSFHIISSRAVQESGSIISISASSSRKSCASCTSRWSGETKSSSIVESRKVLNSVESRRVSVFKRKAVNSSYRSLRASFNQRSTNQARFVLSAERWSNFTVCCRFVRESLLLLIVDNWRPTFLLACIRTCPKVFPIHSTKSTARERESVTSLSVIIASLPIRFNLLVIRSNCNKKWFCFLCW